MSIYGYPCGRAAVKPNIDGVNMRGSIRRESRKSQGRKATIGKPNRRVRKPKRPETYHHGSLREALLQAAERILEREGIQGLTLRAAAREAGVSHAAPKNHFGDLTGLLSELAAVGFERFVAMHAGQRPRRRSAGPAHGRHRPRLRRLRAHLSRALPADVPRRAPGHEPGRPCARPWTPPAACSRARSVRAATRRWRRRLTLPQAADIVGAWSLVHGFAMLLLDGRLKPLLARLPPGTDADALLGAIFTGARDEGVRPLGATFGFLANGWARGLTPSVQW